jgi:hypothetical protein
MIHPAGNPAINSPRILNSYHKVIGNLYLVTSFGFFLFAGVLALVMRAQLAYPSNRLGIAILGSVFNSTYRGDTGQATHGLSTEAAEAARDSLAAALQIAERIGGEPGAQPAQAV